MLPASEHWTQRTWTPDSFAAGRSGRTILDETFGSGSRTFGFEYRGGPNYGYVPYRPRVIFPVPVQPRISTGAPEPWTARWYVYCAERYRSFDPRTGHFRTYSGERRLCR